MSENKQGKLYQKLTEEDPNNEMIGETFFTGEPVLNEDKIKSILDEAKAEAYYEAPTDEWCAQDYVDNYNSLRRWFDKWFGT